MKWRYFPGKQHETLRVFYTGWGMDAHVFEHILTGDQDTLIVWDYTDLDSTTLPLEDRPIELLAWSMGVWAATQTLPTNRIVSAIAVNGTPTPIDDERGIPSAIFDGTLATLSESGLARFRRRMCGGATAMTTFMEHAPQRDLEDLRTELAALGQAIRSRPAQPFPWTQAIGCMSDKIFPIAAQQAAWPNLQTMAGEHYQPDLFERLLKGLPA